MRLHGRFHVGFGVCVGWFRHIICGPGREGGRLRTSVTPATVRCRAQSLTKRLIPVPSWTSTCVENAVDKATPQHN